MSAQPAELDPEACLQAWGVAQTGRLLSTRPRGWDHAAGEADVDFGHSIANHCEKFFQHEDHSHWRELAAHRYVRGQDIATYRWRSPSESALAALMRHGCGYLIERPKAEIPELLLRQFARAFCGWYRDNPCLNPR